MKNDPTHPQVLEQRWFVGVHSNVGGGYADTGLSDLVLGWLINSAQKLGLKVDTNRAKNIVPGYEFKPDYRGIKRRSMAWYYWLFLSYRHRKIMAKRYDSKGELIHTNEVVDESVIQRFRDKSLSYNPKNLREYLAALKPGQKN